MSDGTQTFFRISSSLISPSFLAASYKSEEDSDFNPTEESLLRAEIEDREADREAEALGGTVPEVSVHKAESLI